MKNYEIFNAETGYSLTLNCDVEAAFKFFADVCRLMGYSEVKAELSTQLKKGSAIKEGPFILYSFNALKNQQKVHKLSIDFK